MPWGQERWLGLLGRGVAVPEPRAAMPLDVPCHPGVGAARPHPCAARVWDGELERRRCLKG